MCTLELLRKDYIDIVLLNLSISAEIYFNCKNIKVLFRNSIYLYFDWVCMGIYTCIRKVCERYI